MSEREHHADRIMALATGYWGAGALNAAVSLGVFDALNQKRTISDLAERLSLDPSALENLVHALAGLGILTVEGDGVSIPEALSPWLAPDSKTSLLDALRYNTDLFRLWGNLPGCIASGEPAIPLTQLGADPVMTERFVRGMESRGRWLAPQLIPDLPVFPTAKILDLACGSGIFSRRLLSVHNDLEVTLFDLPGVLEWTRTLWEEDGEAKAEYREGDYRKDDLPRGFDVVLYAGALHQESDRGARSLFSKVRQSLNPGGVFCVVDILLNGNHAESVFGNLFSLNMRLLQPHGHVFSVEDVSAMLASSQFSSVEILPPAGYPYRVLNARV